MVQPPRGFGENPIAIYHDPDLPPSHHYLAAYRWLQQRVRRARHGARRQARQPRMAARQDRRHVRRRAAPTPPRRPAADLPVPGQRPRRGHAGQAPRARHARRPPGAADGPRRVLRRHRPARAAARRARQRSPRWTRRSCPRSAAQIWTLIQAAKLDHDLGLDRPPARRASSTTSSCTSTAGSARSRTPRSATACTCSVQAPTGQARVDMVLAMLRARQMWGGQADACPACARRSGWSRTGAGRADVDARRGDRPRPRARRWRSATGRPTPRPRRARGARAPRTDGHRHPHVRRHRGRAPARRHRRRDRRRAARPRRRLRPGRAVGSPLRGLVNVLPTGRNFYSVDPQAVPSRLAWETGQAMADSLLERYRADHGEWPTSVGLSLWGTVGDAHQRRRHRRGRSRCWASGRSGTRRRGASRASSRSPARSSGRPRIDVDRAHLRVLPRRVPARGRHDRRRGAAGRRARRARRGQLRRAPTCAPTGRARRRPPRHHADLRLASPVRTARACCS